MGIVSAVRGHGSPGWSPWETIGIKGAKTKKVTTFLKNSGNITHLMNLDIKRVVKKL